MSLSRFLTAALLLGSLVLASKVLAQTENASVAGRVTDSSGAVVPKAEIQLQNVDRGTYEQALTNDNGLYVFQSVPPGQYRLIVRKEGFRQVDYVGLIVNVQDHVDENFKLQVGSISESVTVTGVGSAVNTQDASVSTVVNRNFAENLPMNGRSFQTLIELTPGVVVTSANGIDQGQFSVNGQRASSNYWTVDGVSANVSASTAPIGGLGTAGSVGSFSAMGGTNSLVSIDALQEFRIQTSTFAPEFGRTPGAQISIVTRSGQNGFHGSAFDYLRNDKFDANDWFANHKGLPRPQERQNDFGGTFSGPIQKNKSFFFFSYEGLRLRLPQTALSLVPDLSARASAGTSMLPFVNAYPIPNGNDLGNGAAEFNASFSDRSELNAYSLRLDQRVTNKLNLFARYDYSPSLLLERGGGGNALSVLTLNKALLQTATLGASWALSSLALNDFRFNYSYAHGGSSNFLDTFGGAVLFPSIPYPASVDATTSRFDIYVFQFNPFNDVGTGAGGRNTQRQFNIVDSLALQRASHNLKFGVDLRRLSPTMGRETYSQVGFFADAPALSAGVLDQAQVNTAVPATLLLRNLSLFGQDTWRATDRLTVTYGLRWDIDYAPRSLKGPQLAAVTGFNLEDPSNLALASAGTPVFHTRFGNIAPRLGAAYALRNSADHATVLRAGAGMFYDLATSDAGNLFQLVTYPFAAGTQITGGTFPLSSSQAAPPAILPPPGNGFVQIGAYDPRLRTPYTLQWNAAIEQQLGAAQTISATYIGAIGRSLLQQASLFLPNPDIFAALLETNTATSDYHALQIQFQRQMLRGLSLLGAFTWSHSIDNASASSSGGDISNGLVNPLNPNENRGPSSFDIRHSASAALTYEIPALDKSHAADVLTRGWSIQSTLQTRSAPPVDVSDANFFELQKFTATGVIRPDVVAGVPLYLFGSAYPGGKALNPSAFAHPPTDPNTGTPIRQGTLSRNALRAFGATQWDLSAHREFPIHESLRLEFRVEAFNVLNHPNFGPPNIFFGLPGFGLSQEMLGRSLTGSGAGAGGLSPLYQIGGPRSLQLALKLMF